MVVVNVDIVKVEWDFHLACFEHLFATNHYFRHTSAMVFHMESIYCLVVADTRSSGFAKEVCRSMVAMMDADHSGKLGYEEFKVLWTDIRRWRVRF